MMLYYGVPVVYCPTLTSAEAESILPIKRDLTMSTSKMCDYSGTDLDIALLLSVAGVVNHC